MLQRTVAIDVGGTFIDFAYFDEAPDAWSIEKQPSTPAALVDELLDGLGRLPVSADQLDGIFHGTTAGINAVVQERGARVGLITTKGLPRRPRARPGKPARKLQRALSAYGTDRAPLSSARGA